MIKCEILNIQSWPKGLLLENQKSRRYKYHVLQWLISDDPELVVITEDDAGGKSAYRCIYSLLEKRGLEHMVIGTRSHERTIFRKLPNFDYTDTLFTVK